MSWFRNNTISFRFFPTLELSFEAHWWITLFYRIIFHESEKWCFLRRIMITVRLCSPNNLNFSIFIDHVPLTFTKRLSSGKKIGRKFVPIYFNRNATNMMSALFSLSKFVIRSLKFWNILEPMTMNWWFLHHLAE